MMKRMEAKKEKVSRRRLFLSASGVLTLLTVLLSIIYAGYGNSAAVVGVKKELPIYGVGRDDGKIAISFDAAWGGDQTKIILEILDEFGVHTTFFIVDTWTKRFPDLAKEIASRGHEIGNHSTSHLQMSKLSREKIAQELTDMSDHMETLIGTRPTLFRPPYGDYNNLVIETARQMGYEAVQWSVDSQDWKNRGVQDIVNRTTNNIQSGDIVLFHNDAKYIVEALPQVLESYRQKGLTVVPVSELLLSGGFTIDHRGFQIPSPTKIPEVE